MMHSGIQDVQAKCDFQRIERAMANRRLIERIENRLAVAFVGMGVVGATIAALVGAAEGTIFGWGAFAVISALFGLYRWQLRRRWGVLAEQCRAGDPLAFRTFHRSATSYLAIQQLGLLAMMIAVPVAAVAGVVKLIDGDWVRGIWMTLSALMVLPFLPMMWRRVLSRKGRRHEQAVITGEVADTRFAHDSSENRPS